MEKTITIDGKEIRFKSTGATALRYKAQFKKDYFAEILKMASLQKIDLSGDWSNIDPKDLDVMDFEVFYNIAYSFAKTADSSLPDPLTWLDQFESFPILEIIPTLQDMITSSLQSSKKKLPTKSKKQNH